MKRFNLLPGESLNGAVGRYHALALSPAFSSTANQLGLNNQVISPLRFLHGDDVKLDEIFHTSENEKCRYTNSLNQYLSPFLNINEQQYLNTSSGGSHLRISGVSNLNVRHWRWCIDCVEQDEAKYGIEYYHHQHQLPGVYHCYRHGIGLSGHCIQCGFHANKIQDLVLPPMNNACPNCAAWMPGYDGYFSKTMAGIENTSIWLSMNENALSLEILSDLLCKKIGLKKSELGTLSSNRLISSWHKSLANEFDNNALLSYFNNAKPYFGGVSSPLIRKARLRLSSGDPLIPLVHMIALQHQGIDLATVASSLNLETVG
ncbi:TniQ family protein [Moritella sp. 24]|uniref:TniQ family protein n=1 Tax=Moritella sp. 24 TaxID=2746230 RepID=UPI001BA5B3CC|nr:TniQ family protein [Moritella sp. 24]QUM75531.1 TniQ family protein [Moritella sp. 24]